jgi:hypothetical protein
MGRRISLSDRTYLLVSIDLPSAKLPRFVTLMKKLLPMFTSPVPPANSPRDLTFGWTLVTAMRTTEGRSVRVTHLWQVNPVKPWMTEVMEECGTEKNYAALDLLVDREEQNYMHSADHYLPAGATWPIRLPRTCAIETLDVTRFPQKLSDFEVGKNLLSNTGMAELALRAQKVHGWTLLLPLTPETGVLRQFVHVWTIEKRGTTNISTFQRWLRSQPEYREGVESTAIMLAEPLPYAPASHTAP